ncbi:hypothetical protein, variant [Blastomyces gilchristii SLH14081]|uniref:Uncharacterized protein n=1 Tax=Blastomyces gilchristii (strain SLH14081) TaxID=559298 RepID=A0A179UM10_BLAGS|nr:uncharacterized protein BDBG_17126 [Blastomyces gilchristii SLH14081]XP_031578504.1 hypothetical protein, variant [Blastomyces gilchristii SLH14081]OAT08842.1 hypothetical protein BDBG_17126 [Blastomyces gilchristii SLH14081]OAT08843.1 hypothetical protein, variant [Blastomyces gilchristii SLH14081]
MAIAFFPFPPLSLLISLWLGCMDLALVRASGRQRMFCENRENMKKEDLPGPSTAHPLEHHKDLLAPGIETKGASGWGPKAANPNNSQLASIPELESAANNG